MNLKELKSLCDSATPGPWKWGDTVRDGDLSVEKVNEPCMKFLVGSNRQGFASTVGLSIEEDKANADLIAAARTALPELISSTEQLGYLLRRASSKLALYRAQDSGEYIGEMEYQALQDRIDKCLKEVFGADDD